ncbi:MAG TPA: IS256 family transposase [Gemmatimonadales bacterium]|nr:IS256 family transposase [Gemmatimonadales bacterium]
MAHAITTENWDDPLMAAIRPAVRAAIEGAIDAELKALLGAARYERIEGRLGYRHGAQSRTVGTPMGAIAVTVPRARVGQGSATQEWRSALLPRYHRRLRRLDETILGVYLTGTNQRKVAAALRPLLTGVALSKSAVSRLAGHLQLAREEWMQRRLEDDPYVYLYLDGFVVPVRRDGRVVRTPLLIVVGVRATGERVLLAMRFATAESTAGWRCVLEDLVQRGLAAPQLCIIDGSGGLRAALTAVWPTTAIQRCTVHKLRNLQAHAPHHSYAAVKADFHAIIHATARAEAERAYARMHRRWTSRCAAVAESLAEAGHDLLTFYTFPPDQWKALRSTNLIERIHGELRRRIKTQATWSTEHGMLNLLHGLFAAGIIRLRRIDGFTSIASTRPTRKAA